MKKVLAFAALAAIAGVGCYLVTKRIAEAKESKKGMMGCGNSNGALGGFGSFGNFGGGFDNSFEEDADFDWDPGFDPEAFDTEGIPCASETECAEFETKCNCGVCGGCKCDGTKCADEDKSDCHSCGTCKCDGTDGKCECEDCKCEGTCESCTDDANFS